MQQFLILTNLVRLMYPENKYASYQEAQVMVDGYEEKDLQDVIASARRLNVELDEMDWDLSIDLPPESI